WASAGEHRWQDVLAVYAQAGRGLAAAHDVGLVHRDFKPDNAMISGAPDGPRAIDRVHVLDFGLAVLTVDGEQGGALERTQTAMDATALLLTRTGAQIGTPAYMAPEQLLGTRVDAKSDQFAFCVALYEALFGERPFAGTSSEEL